MNAVLTTMPAIAIVAILTGGLASTGAAQSLSSSTTRTVGNHWLGATFSAGATVVSSRSGAASALYANAYGSATGKLMRRTFPAASMYFTMNRGNYGTAVTTRNGYYGVTIGSRRVLDGSFLDGVTWRYGNLLDVFDDDLRAGLDLGPISVSIRGNFGAGVRAQMSLSNPPTGTAMGISGSLAAWGQGRARASVAFGCGVDLTAEGEVGRVTLSALGIIRPGLPSATVTVDLAPVHIRLRLRAWCILRRLGFDVTLAEFDADHIVRRLF